MNESSKFASESGVTYKCPNCDAGLTFDARKQKFVCEFCMSDFSEDEIKATDSHEKAEEKARENAEFSGKINEYNCPNCGAEIITDKSTVMHYCYYCHNPIVLSDRVSGAMKPSKIIPFKFDKNKATEIFLGYTKKKWFLPKNYFASESTDKISGVYYPFWVVDADTDSTLSTIAHRVRTWRVGNYRYTETSNFAVKRNGAIHFEDISASAIKDEDKEMLEGILPYPLDAYSDFEMPYLLGYSAKKRDIERESLSAEVRDRMHGYAKTLLMRTVNNYTSVDEPTVGITVNSSHWEYALLPIWILTYKKETKRKTKYYTYAMNGYTGKIYGKLPVSIPKLALLFGAVASAATLIMTLIARFLL